MEKKTNKESDNKSSHCSKCRVRIGENDLFCPDCGAKIIVMAVKKKVKGIANITGGGFIDNIPRIFPKGLGAEIKKGSWPIHKVFTYIQDKGNVEEKEMYRTLNMGIGMVFIVDKKFRYSDIKKIEDLGTKVYEVGRVIEKEGVTFS